MRTFTRTTEIIMRRLLNASLIATLFVSTQTKVQATPFAWTNNAGGNWSTNGNWDMAGDPNGAGDTASMGDLAGAYTVTLDATRAIGELSMTGSHPTLQLDNPLVISGGTSTIGGSALVTGSSTMQWSSGAVVNWTSTTAPTGTLTFQVEPNNNVNINNTSGSFGIATGQALLLDGTNSTVNGKKVVFSNGFSSSGLIQLGRTPGTDGYSFHKLNVTSGQITNNVGGTIAMYPRSASHIDTYSNRQINAGIKNDGTINNVTWVGYMGLATEDFENSASGVINLDSTIYTNGKTAQLTVYGDQFINNGMVNINDGRFTVATNSYDYNAGTLGIDPTGVLALGHIGTSGTMTTAVDWTGEADLAVPMTFEISGGARVTLARDGAWTLPSNQTLHLRGRQSTVNGFFTLDQDFTNESVVNMGALTGDEYGYQYFDLPSNTFTNDTTGVLNMFARTASVSYGIRKLRADVDNDGQINVYTYDAQLGNTGKTITNTGTITLDSTTLSNLTSGFAIPQLTIYGDDFDNTGTVNINDGRLVVATETYDYNSGTLNIDPTGILALGRVASSGSITTTVDWTGEPDLTVPMTFEISGGSRVDLLRDGEWTLPSNQTLHFRGRQSTANGIFTLDQDFTNNSVVNMGALTGDEYGNQYFDLPSHTFTNNASGMLNMFARTANVSYGIRQLRADIVNDGQINMYTYAGQLGTTGKTITNNGTIRIDPEILSNLTTGSGIPQLSVVGDSFVNSATGRIEGDGKLVVTGVTGGLMNDGTLAPGLSAGTLDITGNVTNSATSALEIELGGLIAGTEHDQLNITQTFAIDGDLVITLIDGFGSSVTSLDTFTIATFASVTGTFSNMNDEDRVTIQDFDIDGRFYSFLVTINATNVTLSDFQINPVPEPSSAILLGLGVFGLLRHTRRRRPKA